MNYSIIIEIASMLLIFGVLVFGMLLLETLSFISDYPPEIQRVCYRSRHVEETRRRLILIMKIKKAAAIFVFLLVFAWMLNKVGVRNFWEK